MLVDRERVEGRIGQRRRGGQLGAQLLGGVVHGAPTS